MNKVHQEFKQESDKDNRKLSESKQPDIQKLMIDRAHKACSDTSHNGGIQR